MTPSEGKDSDSSDSRKTLIILIFLTCSVESFRFSFSSPAFVVDFIGTMKSNYAFEVLFPLQSHFFIVVLPLCWAFAVLGHFPFFFSFFSLFFNFK